MGEEEIEEEEEGEGVVLLESREAHTLGVEICTGFLCNSCLGRFSGIWAGSIVFQPIFQNPTFFTIFCHFRPLFSHLLKI